MVSTVKYVIPFFLADFLNQNKGVKMVVDVTDKEKVLASLVRNEMDFALVSVLPQHLKTDKIDLMQPTLFLIGNHIHCFKKCRV